jgi:ATP-dependent helicase IRC3
VATYQTLNISERLAKFNPSKLKAVIVDEAHHAAAPSQVSLFFSMGSSSFRSNISCSYRRLLSKFNPDIQAPDKNAISGPEPLHKVPIIGFSATFSRHDGLALGSVFERIVYHRNFLEMIKEQW